MYIQQLPPIKILYIDETQFSCNEQYIQHAKALLSKDTITASKILKANKNKYYEKARRKSKKTLKMQIGKKKHLSE